MLWPRGSTAAIALVFSPVFILIIAMPAGAAAGWLFGAAWARTGVVVRLLLCAAAVPIIGLVFIAFARPELFPTNVRAREAARAAIGEPRVAAGADRFARTPVSDASSWKVVGEFDGAPGDELALVTHKGAQLYDAHSLQPTTFIAFGGEPGRLWNWFSRLVRIGDTFVVAQTGGGFSDTELRSLENAQLWQFKPDPRLSPSAMLPADLDEDGEIEFYASSTDALTRLNPRGEPVWNRQATLSDLVAVVPRAGSDPPWVVAARYQASVDVWTPAGDRIAEVKWTGDPVIGVVDWPAGRGLLAAGASATVVDLKGVRLAELPGDPLTRVFQGMSWKPDAASPALLALVSGGDEDLDRWRLRVYATPQQVVYDEVFDTPLRLLAARHADGAGTLFVIAGDALTVLRRH
jgi:hypothetical protein